MGPNVGKRIHRHHFQEEQGNPAKQAYPLMEEMEDLPTVVWCDSSVGDDPNSEDHVNTYSHLARLINHRRNLVHMFTDANRCRDFILHTNNIYLIVSGSVGKTLVPIVHHLDKLHSIFIFCIDKARYEQMAETYTKIRGVYTDINEICESLRPFIPFHSTFVPRNLHFDVWSTRCEPLEKSQQELVFIYSIFSKRIVSNLNDVSTRSMIEFCLSELQNRTQQNLINQFKDYYNKRSPIWWFTRDSAIEHIVHQALKFCDFYALCMISPFLIDLNNELIMLQQRQSSTLAAELRLYFGRSIPNNEFEMLKSNPLGLICIHEFFSANPDRQKALVEIDGILRRKEAKLKANVLFEIFISASTESDTLYAKVDGVSDFVHKDDYLFSMSSIFRIESIGRRAGVTSGWLVQLTLLDKCDLQLTGLMSRIDENELYKRSSLPILSSVIFNQLCEFKSARKLFEQKFLSNAQLIRSIHLRYNFGIISDTLHDYADAIVQYKRGILLTREFHAQEYPKDEQCLIPFYSNLGITYQHKKWNSDAINHAFRASAIVENYRNNSIYYEELSTAIYSSIGRIFQLQNKTSEAISIYKKALELRTQSVPSTHPDIINLQLIINSLSSEEADENS